MAVKKRLLVLAGDGIGPEVIGEVLRVFEWIETRGGISFEIDEDLAGGCAIDADGTPLPERVRAKADRADAILLGAVGGPKWEALPFEIRPEQALLGLRKGLDLYANLRPARLSPAMVDASSLKPSVVEGLDLMIVRELAGGIYFGTPRGVEVLGDGVRRGFNTQSYTSTEISRVARVAFDLARERRGALCSVEKANVMESGQLWRDVVTEIGAADYPDVRLSHMYADNCAMQLVRAPRQFDVIVTDNLFGDILSDCAAMLTGSLGMLPSASLGSRHSSGGRKSLYEPVHGTAPDIAGRGIANPLGSILSFGMMMRYSFHAAAEADAIEQAVASVLGAGIRTPDILIDGRPPVSTSEMGRAVVAELDRMARP
jgi:3-isopropylmalate dehydrogenase